jgi:hypothetical protein
MYIYEVNNEGDARGATTQGAGASLETEPLVDQATVEIQASSCVIPASANPGRAILAQAQIEVFDGRFLANGSSPYAGQRPFKHAYRPRPYLSRRSLRPPCWGSATPTGHNYCATAPEMLAVLQSLGLCANNW